MEGHRLWVKHEEFILVLLQTTVLSRSDAENDGIEPASGFVIKNH